MSTRAASTRKVSNSSIVAGSIPSMAITNVYITDSSYNVLDDTAVNNAGGYIRILGVGFLPGYSLYLNGVIVASSTYISTGEIRAVTPSIGNGSYNLTLFNTNNTGAIYSLTFSGFPTWTTGSYISNTATINVQLLATGDGTLNYYLQSGSTLPTGVTLSSTGLLSGTISGAVSGTVYSFTVLVDDAQLQTSQQAITLTLQFTDTYYKNTTLMLTGETSGTPFTNDASTNSVPLTIAGDTKPTQFIPYYNDGYYSVYFDGASYLAATPVTGVTIGTNDFCFEGWGYWTSFNYGTYGAALCSLSGTSSELLMRGTKTSAATTTANWFSNINGSTYIPSAMYSAGMSFGTLYLYRWHHLAVQRVSGTWYFYIDGVQVGTTSTGDASLSVPYTVCYVGNDIGGSNGYLAGNASNIRLTVGSAPYAVGGFTVPTSPLTNITNTKFLLAQSNGYVDKSFNNSVMTKSGTISVQRFSPFTTPTSVTVNTGYSVYFNGTTDYLTVASNASLAIGTGDFTVECWVYPQSTVQFTVLYLTSTFQLFMYNGALYWNDGTQTSGGTITLNTWQHIAVTRSGTTLKGFINGTQVISTTSSVNLTQGTNYVGYNGGTLSPGYISNLRLIKGNALYTGAFTPSTTPLTAITNTVLLTCQDSQISDTSTNALAITPNGSPKVVNNTYPFTQTTQTVSNLNTLGSTYFVGSGGYLTTSTTSLLGTTFTIEFWIYFNTFTSGDGNYQNLFGVNNTISTTGNFILLGNYNGSSFAAGALTFFHQNSQKMILPAGTFALGKWSHVAVVRNAGTSLKMYVDGLSVGTATINSGDQYGAAGVGYIVGSQNDFINRNFNGYISNLRIVNGTAVYLSNFAPPAAPLTAITNTSLLTLQYNGGATNYGIIDTSTSNNILTRYGNATQGSFSPYSVTGWSNYFNGTSDYFTAAASSTQLTFTGNWTIEFWINSNQTTRADILCANYTYTSTGWFMISLGLTSASSIDYCETGGGAGKISGTLNRDGLWHHVALTKSSTSMKLFIDGTQTGSTYTTSQTQWGSSGNGWIIGDQTSSSTYYQGYISNFRALNGTALYTTTFTPPTSPLIPITNTSFLTCQSNRFIDNSPNNLAITTSGTPSVQALSPFGSISEATPLSYSVYFAGSSTTDYLTVAHNTALNLSSGDFTIEAWVYRVELASNLGTILNKDGVSGSTYPSYQLYLTYPSSDYRVNFQVGNGTSAVTVQTITSTVALPLGQWVHVAATRLGTTLTLWQNGVSVATATQTATIVDGSKALLIGYQTSAASTAVWSGYISNVRIIKGNALYSTAFTPSTAPLTAIVNTQLLTCQSSTIIDNSTNNFTVKSGSTAGLTRVYKYNPFGYTTQLPVSYSPSLHGGSMYFDGTGDYLTAANSRSFDLSANKWTIECWFYQTSAKLAQLFSVSAASWRLQVSADGSGSFVFNTSSVTSYPAGSFPPGQWNHISASFFNDGTNTQQRSHANGKLIAVGLYGPNADTSSLFYIGTNKDASGAWDFNGYITDLRIIKGDCLYYDSFVPPIAPLTVTPNTVFFANGTNGGIIDYHGTNNLESVGNALLSTSVKKYGVSSISFSGSSQSLKIPSNPWSAFGTGDFTVEAWIYYNAAGANSSTITDFRSGSTGTNFLIYLGPSATLTFYATGAARITGNTMSTGRWYHIAVTRASGSTKMFVDGTQVGSTFADSYNYAQTDVYIGSDYTTATLTLNGYIDDLRITKGFARYTGNFTAPTLTPPIL